MTDDPTATPLSVALVGVGGFGATFIPALLTGGQQHGFRFVGGVDPFADKSKKLPELRAANVPVYATMDELYDRVTPGLVILATPIPLHARQTTLAVGRGSHVLCEKPIAATPAEAQQMKAARDAAKRHVAIGYQWSFSRATQALKADALAGIFGKLKRMRTVVLWPRDEAYYARNDWAGAIKNRRGDWVLDSPVNNACAHHLHHMFYVAGDAVDRSATPTRMTAELYRANPIQNFDTAALRLDLPGGAEALFYVTHAGQKTHHPVYTFEFEHATVEQKDENDAHIVATFNDGRRKNYGTTSTDYRDGKLWETLAAIRDGRPTLCGIEAATPHCQVVWACQQMNEKIKTFAAHQLENVGGDGHNFTTVPGMDDALLDCWHRGVLPSEAGVKWATSPTTVAVDPV